MLANRKGVTVKAELIDSFIKTFMLDIIKWIEHNHLQEEEYFVTLTSGDLKEAFGRQRIKSQVLKDLRGKLEDIGCIIDTSEYFEVSLTHKMLMEYPKCTAINYKDIKESNAKGKE